MVIVDEKNFDKIDAALGTGFYRMDYIRMWWPMQDYFNLSSDRDPNLPFAPDYACKGLLSFLKLVKTKDFTPFCEAFTNPVLRAGIVQIWLDRDYTQYATAKGRTDLTLTTWSPADKMRLYIKKDVAAQIWNYGVSPATQPKAVDPTEGKYIALPPDRVLTVGPTPMNAPRSLATAKDGTIYVADTRNHRVVHLDMDGKVLQTWGSFADGVSIAIGNGTFNEPWGIAIGPDNSVYVTDTWNHRIEKFTPDGKFITAWGVFGQGQTPDSFYGPRGLAMDSQGRLYVTDTGNKRVVVFDENGNFITQFGSGGMDPGQFDEPVGIAVDKNGTVYVVDTWNQRIQTFSPIETEGNLSFGPNKQWDVYGWFGQSVNNKPFIAVDDNLNVFISDPDGFRMMEFDPNGVLVRVWDGLDSANSSMDPGTPSGVAVDMEGHIWITDSTNNRLMRFTLP
jgi:DNA-binding beta-propeller fold protein YncE